MRSRQRVRAGALWRARARALLAALFALSLALTANAAPSQAPVHPSSVAAASLCLEVDITLQQVTSALQSCGGSPSPSAATPPGNDSDSSSSTGKKHRGRIANVDLSPVRRLMRVLGCEERAGERRSPSHRRADTRASHTSTESVAAAITQESTLDAAGKGGHNHPQNHTSRAVARTASSSLASRVANPQQPGTPRFRTIAAPAAETRPHKSVVKPPTAAPVQQRTRRAQHVVGTGECTFRDILNSTCTGPSADARLTISLSEHDDTAPRGADTQHMQLWSVGVQTLIIAGAVHEEPLRWLLADGNWSAVTLIRIHGLQFQTVSFDMLNHLPSLRVVTISNNDHITLSTTGFTRAQQIRFLAITNSTLRQITHSVFTNFSNLEHLNLERNAIIRVDTKAFSGLPWLARLDLGHNLLTSIEKDALHSLSNLQVLSLRRNNLTALAAGVFDGLEQLEELDLGFNLLASLDDDLFHPFRSLRVLSLQGLRLASLPDGIFKGLSMLRCLDLTDNYLTSLQPGTFSHLASLVELRLTNGRISMLSPGIFDNLRHLRELQLTNNRLSALPVGLLRSCTKLRDLLLSNNLLKSLPADLLRSAPLLKRLALDDNNLGTLDIVFANATSLQELRASRNKLTAFTPALPGLGFLTLEGNPIEQLPDVARMVNLKALRMSGHRIPRIDLTPILNLKYLFELDVRASSSVRSTATVERSAAAHWDGNSLHTLRTTHVDMSDIFTRDTDFPQRHFTTLDIGWPGLDEQSLSPKTLCSLLTADARELGIRNSGYRHIELCPDLAIQNINLQDNTALTTITASHSIRQLNVSGCAQLESINVPSVAVLDVSNTKLHATPALCDTLGHRIVFARDVPKAAIDDVTLDRCLKTVDLLDLSDNAWLSSPAEINEIVGAKVVISGSSFYSLELQPISSRSTPVAFLLHRSPVECTAVFGAHVLLPRLEDGEIGFAETELVYFFECKCTRGHVMSGGNCTFLQLDVTAMVLGSLAGGLVILVPVLLWLHRRYRRSRKNVMLHRQLLLESHEEVLALKKAWEIGFDELQLIKRVAAGAFGVVYKAEWDTVMVAVKVLQEGVMAFDESSVDEFEKEVEFLQRTRHPHVVRFFGAGTDPNGTPFLVLEFVALGSLKDFLQKGMEAELRKALAEDTEELSGQHAHDNVGTAEVPGEDATLVTNTAVVNKRWSQLSESHSSIATVWDLKLRLLQDVASGMAFIHSLGQVHRDLKSGNVLVSANLRAKITDFGSIRQCFTRSPTTSDTAMSSASHDPIYSQAVGLATTVDMTMTAEVGTPLYMAPEALSGGSYGAQADVFSFGVLMWEVALQRVPDLIEQEKGADFRGPLLSTLHSLLREGKRLTFAYVEAADVPDWYVQVYRRCVLWDPKERPTFEQLNKSALRCDQKLLVQTPQS